MADTLTVVYITPQYLWSDKDMEYHCDLLEFCYIFERYESVEKVETHVLNSHMNPQPIT